MLEHKPGDQPWVVEQAHAPRWCWTGVLSDVVMSFGTPPVRRWVPLAGGAARGGDDDVGDDDVGVLGDQLVRRTPMRALVLKAGDGSQRELVPGSCGGWSVLGTVKTHCRNAARGNTRVTRCAAVSAMRRAVQLGQMPRDLQENATTISPLHAWHRTRQKP
jgi:hypothetical protein